MENKFIRADDVAQELSVSKPYAYKLIRKLNEELKAQGFKGGSRGDTEWSQWVLSEKEQLAAVMERYGIEWKQKGTHEKHLSVLDYKKQERAEEIEQLESKIIDKQTEFETLSKRIQNFDKGTDSLLKCRMHWRMLPNINILNDFWRLSLNGEITLVILMPLKTY